MLNTSRTRQWSNHHNTNRHPNINRRNNSRFNNNFTTVHPK